MKFDTRPQYEQSRERRALGLALFGILFALGAYFLISWDLALRRYGPYLTSGVPLLLAIVLLFFSLGGLVLAFSRRIHPVAVELTPQELILTRSDGRRRVLRWKDRPVDVAYDSRSSPADGGGRPGWEVRVWVPVEGRQPGSEAFRPEELILSGRAFDEIKMRMRRAGFRVVSQRWSRRRPGELVQFLAPGEEPRSSPIEVRRRGILRTAFLSEPPAPFREENPLPPETGDE